MSVTGVGGVFFRANDPKALREWYLKHLGIDAFHWLTQAGQTVLMPFPKDTDYFPAGKQWMLNLRVKELNKLIATLRDAGIEIITKVEWDTPETGKFARIYDPDGNPIELWEPPVE